MQQHEQPNAYSTMVLLWMILGVLKSILRGSRKVDVGIGRCEEKNENGGKWREKIMGKARKRAKGEERRFVQIETT